MNNEITLRLNSPITNEQWDAITDVDFEHTDRIRFHTKHGKDVEFVKDSSALHESCTDCPLYDHDGYRCPRFNKVIPTAILDALQEWTKGDALNLQTTSKQSANNLQTSKQLANDSISRQAAIDAARKCSVIEVTPEYILVDKDEMMTRLMMLPTAQSEPSIPISWIKQHIEWLNGLDNSFSKLTAIQISTLIKSWEGEHDEQIC